jgi:hypothetical protein
MMAMSRSHTTPTTRPAWLRAHLVTLAAVALLAVVVSVVIVANPPAADAPFPDSLDLRGAMIAVVWIFVTGFAATSSLLRALLPGASRGATVLVYAVAAVTGAGAVALVNVVSPF